MHAIIDADILAYSAANQVDTIQYHLKVGRRFKGTYTRKVMATKASKRYPLKDVEIIKERISGKVEDALDLLFKQLTNLEQTFDSFTYVISSPGKGWRDDIATIRTYKGNRDKADKPTNLGFMYNYLKELEQTVMSEPGDEADDAISIMAYGYVNPKDCVIASLDKDMHTIPGYHYNWRTRTTSFITNKVANLNFYRQCLTGDSVDNIIGIPGIGKKRADAYFTEVHPETASDFLGITQKAYIEFFRKQAKKHKVPLIEADIINLASRALTENGRLLWLKRSRDSDFNFTGDKRELHYSRSKGGCDDAP